MGSKCFQSAIKLLSPLPQWLFPAWAFNPIGRRHFPGHGDWSRIGYMAEIYPIRMIARTELFYRRDALCFWMVWYKPTPERNDSSHFASTRVASFSTMLLSRPDPKNYREVALDHWWTILEGKPTSGLFKLWIFCFKLSNFIYWNPSLCLLDSAFTYVLKESLSTLKLRRYLFTFSFSSTFLCLPSYLIFLLIWNIFWCMMYSRTKLSSK